MTVDWSIRFADVLSIVGFLTVAVGAVMVMKGDIGLLGLRLAHLEDTVKKETEIQNKKIDKQSEDIGRFAELLNMMGRYEERMINMQREINDLKRGRGFISDEVPAR